MANAEIYLDRDQCDYFEVSYFEKSDFGVRADILLASKSSGYDDFHFNTELNHCSQDIKIFWSDVLDWNDFSYDLILANIEKNIIKKMINNIKNTNARFIFSGLLIEDKDEIEKLLIKNNFKIEDFKSKNEWLLVDCKKI